MDRRGLARNPNGDGVYSPTGIYGDPTLATKEKGKTLTDALVEEIINQVMNLIKLWKKSISLQLIIFNNFLVFSVFWISKRKESWDRSKVSELIFGWTVTKLAGETFLKSVCKVGFVKD